MKTSTAETSDTSEAPKSAPRRGAFRSKRTPPRTIVAMDSGPATKQAPLEQWVEIAESLNATIEKVTKIGEESGDMYVKALGLVLLTAHKALYTARDEAAFMLVVSSLLSQQAGSFAREAFGIGTKNAAETKDGAA